VEFELGGILPAHSTVAITLALSIFKFDRMEWAIEKCTELGVAQIIPVVAQRTEAHLASAAAKRVERWERITRQAAEQSRRGAPAEISKPIKLKEALALPGAMRVVLAESEHEVMLADVIESGASGDSLTLAVGPEGGWTEAELKLFRDAGWAAASLGNTILRAETAAIAATAIAVSQLG
jgi:16S rRNA (uracil1498-N3)-methyltransferase